MDERIIIGADVEFIRFLKENGGETMKKCYQCATCTVACSLTPKDYAFPRKEMIHAGWGLKEKLVNDADIWLCHQCMDCSERCPRHARPADLLSAVRSYVYRFYATPGFMGKALSLPKYLPLLLLLPVMLISMLVMVTQNWNINNLFPIINGPFRYKDLVAHGPLEMLFIFGNVLVFLLAFMGFRKYWKDLEQNYKGQIKKSFFMAVYEVILDFIVHRKFNSCVSNSNRYFSHLFVFYGFIGALIATGIVVFDVTGIFGKFLPEDMNMPVYLLGDLKFNSWEITKEYIGLATKTIGLFSGFLLVIGGLMMLLKRYNIPENEGKSTYYDMLFLWMLWGVSLTGLLCVVFRLTELPVLGYPTYYIHLILVYFLLWYMPYSKFAHMIYRFLGLTFLKMRNRENKQVNFFNN